MDDAVTDVPCTAQASKHDECVGTAMGRPARWVAAAINGQVWACTGIGSTERGNIGIRATDSGHIGIAIDVSAAMPNTEFSRSVSGGIPRHTSTVPFAWLKR